MTTPLNRYAALVALAVVLPLGAALAHSPSLPPQWTVTTVFTDRPDLGNHDNPVPGQNSTWANDTFKQEIILSFDGQAAPSFCPGITSGQCYYWTAQAFMSNGSFSTNPTSSSGASAPGGGTGGTGATGPFPIGVAAKGVMSARYHFGFYASAGTASAAGVPTAENDHGTLPYSAATATCTGGTPATCGVSTCLWVTTFFRPGTQYWDLTGTLNPPCLGLYWAWTYFLPMGADESCPMIASKWVSASWNNVGKDPVDGNILAPDAAHC